MFAAICAIAALSVALVLCAAAFGFFCGKSARCPFWLGYLIDNPLRQLVTKQPRALARLVPAGACAADVGCGHGTNTLTLAALVGPAGRVWAVDVSPQMLAHTRAKAARRGFDGRIEFVRCTPLDPGLPTATLDFVLLSAVLHECPDAGLMLQAVYDALRPGGRMLLAEPPVHVPARRLALEAALACEIGFRHTAEVPMGWLNALSFQKP